MTCIGCDEESKSRLCPKCEAGLRALEEAMKANSLEFTKIKIPRLKNNT